MYLLCLLEKYFSLDSVSSQNFVGNYVIIVAFMSMISISNTPELQDYIQPVAVTSDSGKPNEKSKRNHSFGSVYHLMWVCVIWSV